MERRRSVQEYVGRDVEKDLFRPFRTVNGSSPVLLLTKKTRPAKICQESRRLNKGIIENILLYNTFLSDGSFQHVSGADYTSSRHVFKPIAADRANARACTGCQLRDPRTHGTVGGEASSAYETYAASDLQDLGYCRVLSSWNSFLDMYSLLQAKDICLCRPCPVRDRATTAIM